MYYAASRPLTPSLPPKADIAAHFVGTRPSSIGTPLADRSRGGVSVSSSAKRSHTCAISKSDVRLLRSRRVDSYFAQFYGHCVPPI
jgi:hypothetical protein